VVTLCCLPLLTVLTGCSSSRTHQIVESKEWRMNGYYDFREILRRTSSAYVAAEEKQKD
jgi:hypothetical protein